MIGTEVSHYKIERELGAGGMGVVYLAQDNKLNRKVALKFLPEDRLRDPSRRRRFLTEARAASALTHPHVCVIHEVNETPEGWPYIVMEYVDGLSLDRWARQHPRTARQIVDIGVQVAEALEGAWEKRIVHRDIKPSNIVLNAKGRIKVLDFGVARMEPETFDSNTQLATGQGQIVGTPHYMSPEQALGREVNVRSDLFSLGVVLYELACARRPFTGNSAGEILNQVINRRPESPARVDESVPLELDRIILKCLEKNPDYRYQTPTDLLVDLHKLSRRAETADWTTTTLHEPESDVCCPFAEDANSPAATPPPSAEVVARSDVFINCSQVDDRVIGSQGQGWVSDFLKHLELRIEQLSGERINICLHALPPGESELDAQLMEKLPSVKAMLSIISPPFLKSDGCRLEVKSFWDRASETGGRWINNRSRLFQVVKTPVDQSELPPEFSELFPYLERYEFFERDPETGRVRQYDESFGSVAKQKYFERVYDLSQEVCRLLKDLRDKLAGRIPEGGAGKTIYLAVTTSDVTEDWERLRRELSERGHHILPDRPLPPGGPEIHAAVRDWLAQSDFSIHMVGSRYGYIPEEADCSIVELQHKLAIDRKLGEGAKRYIWLPRSLNPTDARQAKFIRSILDSEETHRRAEVIQDSLENLKTLLLDQLKPRPPALPAPASGGAGLPKIYLLFDARDEQAAEPLEDFLFSRGMEILTLSAEVDEIERESVHRRNLLLCDGVLIYYGQVSRSWVEMKLMDLLQAPGYGRERSFLSKAVYLASPFDRRKERFKTHVAETIEAREMFDPSKLRGFLDGLASAASSSH